MKGKSYPMSIKVISVLLAVSFFIAGCGGSNPNPVARYQPGDEDKSCMAISAQMNNVADDIVTKNKKIHDRDVGNVICFVTGFLVIVPWFFIDTKKSFETEIDALKARKNSLMTIFHDKDCKAPVANEEK